MSTTAPSSLRVAVVGASGSGRHEVMEAISRRYEGGEPERVVVGEIALWRTEWKQLGDDEVAQRMILRAVDDAEGYAAAEDLLVREADAVIFVFDVRREHLQEGWLALQRVADSAQRGGFDLRARPLVLQYHRCDGHPGFQPSQMDAWLGLPPGKEVARVVTSSSNPDGDGAVLEALWRQDPKPCGVA